MSQFVCYGMPIVQMMRLIYMHRKQVMAMSLDLETTRQFLNLVNASYRQPLNRRYHS